MNKEIKKKLVRFENFPFVLLSTQELWDNERKMKLDRLIKVEKGLPVGGKCLIFWKICKTDMGRGRKRRPGIQSGAETKSEQRCMQV